MFQELRTEGLGPGVWLGGLVVQVSGFRVQDLELVAGRKV